MPMIIKGIRIRSSSSISRTIRHLENGNENDAVNFVSGTPADIRDMHRDAVSVGSRYAVRHWIIAPHERMSRQQMAETVEAIAKEFAFDPARIVIVEHQKKRSTTDAADIHWHMLVGEVDPITGRILSTSYDRIRHELLARVAEFNFGHAFVYGKHTEAVVKGLRKRGLHCVADRLEEFLKPSDAKPVEAFTHARHQQFKRNGLDLPALRQAIKRLVANARRQEDVAKGLADLGLEAKAGDKPGTWIIVDKVSGNLVGALHRLAGSSKGAMNDLMSKTVPHGDQENRGADDPTLSGSNTPLENRSSSSEPDVVMSDAICQFARRLAEIEGSALNDLRRAIPDFEISTAMKEAREEASVASHNLSRAVLRRTELHLQINNIPPIRWWSWLTGAAERRRKKVEEFASMLQGVNAEILRSETAIIKSRRKEIQAEQNARAAHAAVVLDVAQHQKKAREVLAVLEQAKILLEEKPTIVAKGFDFLLASAKSRLRKNDAVSEHLLEHH